MQQKMSPQRYQRIRQLLALRQPDLSLCLEDMDKPHNVSAVVRTCDAVGVPEVHAVWDHSQNLRKSTAMGSEVWVGLRRHDTIDAAIGHLKQQNMQILVTHLDDSAVDFRDIDYTKPTAVLLGQEKRGATPHAVSLCDQAIMVPMVGMVQSLNVSVAAAVVMYEAQRQRLQAGMYEQSRLDEESCQRILFQGGFPLLYKECVRRELPFPHIDEHGSIIASQQWWQALQYSA